MDDMVKKLPGFFRRPNGFWYYRARVPKDLHPYCKQRETWIALDTKDEGEARTKFHIVAAQKLREYDELRKRFQGGQKLQIAETRDYSHYAVDREEAVLLAKAYLAECLGVPDSRKTARDWGDGADNVRAELSFDLGCLLDPSDRDEGRALVQTTARSLLERGGHAPEALQSLDADFLALVRRTLVALRSIELERLDDNFRDDPGDAELTDFNQVAFTSAKTRSLPITVAQAIDKLWKEQIEPERKAPKTSVKYEAAFKLLARFLGEDTPLRQVTREQLVEYRDTLMQMPSNYSKKFPGGTSFAALTAEASRAGYPQMKYKTREAYISLMKRLFRWASSIDYIKKDISAGIPVGGKRISGRNKRGSFEVDELNIIFRAPVFTGCVDDNRNYAKPGNARPRRSRFWAPLIALYTGMRMGEILQLRVEHVRVSPKGNPFFYLTEGVGEDDGDEDFIAMELKTENSRREVPIHHVLVGAGFMDFVNAARLRNQSELFPEVQLAADGKKSTIFSKRFSRFLAKAGVKPNGDANCFHMFRHSLRDAIRDCNIPEEIADAVQGWAREEDEGRNYGNGFRVDAIYETWQRLKYDGFDYSHLMMSDAVPSSGAEEKSSS